MSELSIVKILSVLRTPNEKFRDFARHTAHSKVFSTGRLMPETYYEGLIDGFEWLNPDHSWSVVEYELEHETMDSHVGKMVLGIKTDEIPEFYDFFITQVEEYIRLPEIIEGKKPPQPVLADLVGSRVTTEHTNRMEHPVFVIPTDCRGLSIATDKDYFLLLADGNYCIEYDMGLMDGDTHKEYMVIKDITAKMYQMDINTYIKQHLSLD